MIRFEDVSNECFASMSFEIGKGSVSKIILSSDYDRAVMLETALGLRRPKEGRVFLLGQDIYSLPAGESFKLFRRTGVVRRDGGLISNLKVWENIALPLWYHEGRGPSDIEARVIGLFGRMGMDADYLKGYMGRLPGPLPLHEKALIGLVRAMLTEPELMVYESLLEGLAPDKAGRLLALMQEFHSEKPGRTSVYLSSDEKSLEGIKADVVLRQKGRGCSL